MPSVNTRPCSPHPAHDPSARGRLLVGLRPAATAARCWAHRGRLSWSLDRRLLSGLRGRLLVGRRDRGALVGLVGRLVSSCVAGRDGADAAVAGRSTSGNGGASAPAAPPSSPRKLARSDLSLEETARGQPA